MNNTLQAQAKNLYFQSDLSKTEISDLLGIPRRTLHYWIREKNWDRIKRSAMHMPSLLAENVYHVIARFTQQLLGEDRINRPITHKEADTLHKLTLTVSKLKNRATLNESMEMFGVFMDNVHRQSPEMAQQITPFVDDYIAGRAATNIHQFRPDNMNDLGLIPKQEENLTEEQLDLQDIMEWTEAGNPIIDLELPNDPKEPSPASQEETVTTNTDEPTMADNPRNPIPQPNISPEALLTAFHNARNGITANSPLPPRTLRPNSKIAA